jgi:CubicO group peptidase (beta-lactamase class C family)
MIPQTSAPCPPDSGGQPRRFIIPSPDRGSLLTMTMTRWAPGVTVVVALVAVAAGQGAGPAAQARVDAFFRALSSGVPETYEAMAREHFAPSLLARRTAEERQGMVERIRADFGALTLAGEQADEGGTVELTIRGATGLEGRIELAFEPAPPNRITGVAVRLGPGAGRDVPILPAPPITATMAPDALSAALDAYLSTLAGDGTFAGVVLVARDGVPVFTSAYGLADRDHRVANTVATRFNLGSINKAFTKTAVGQLFAQGKLAPGDTIARLLPDYPNARARAATVDQLLEHRAGIADFFGPAFHEAPKTQFRSNADYVRFVAPQPLLFEPGTRTQYCNGCYIVLGAIIERVSGVPYEDYVVGHVFKPAGMTGAGFLASDHLPPDAAIGYTRRSPESRELRSSAGMHGVAGSAAGGAFATAGDLLAFHTALRNGRLLDAARTAWFFGEEAGHGGHAKGDLSIAGGAPGVSAALESDGIWTFVVLTNLDPPIAEQVGAAIRRSLTR